MKVLNLQCTEQHGFEGWFGSEDDFQSQLSRCLVACPMCGSTVVHKLPSAPRLNLLSSPSFQPAAARVSETASVPPSAQRGDVYALASGPAALATEAAQAAFLSAVREVLQNTEDVGSRFAEEARRIHYGETESRNIRGLTSPREAVDLIEEGIDVMPLPLSARPKQTLQ